MHNEQWHLVALCHQKMCGMQMHARSAHVAKLPFLRFRLDQQMSLRQSSTDVFSVDINRGKADNQCWLMKTCWSHMFRLY